MTELNLFKAHLERFIRKIKVNKLKPNTITKQFTKKEEFNTRHSHNIAFFKRTG